MLRPALAGSLVAAALLVAVPAAAVAEPAKAPAPPTDDGFPLEDYFRDVFKGKLFVGGAPAAVVGAKTKDKATIVGGKAHFQPQLALRRVGRDDGKGRFLVLKSRSYGSALAYMIKLNRGLVRFFQVAFPKAIGGTKFPPAYASLKYTFEVAPDSPAPKFAAVGVASAPHPDKALARKGVSLVTLKKGFTPGNHIVRVTTEADCCFNANGSPHDVKRLYDAYETANSVAGWVKLAVGPVEVVLEQAVDVAIGKLIDAAANGNVAAQQALTTRALKEQYYYEKVKRAATAALTKSEVVVKLTVPTKVPDLRFRTQADAEATLKAHFLRWTWRYEETRTPEFIGKVKSQSIKPNQKRPVGTHIFVRVYTPTALPPPPTTTVPTPPPPGTSVPFGAPKVVERIKALGFQYEPFNVVACDTRVAGACDPRNARSQLREAARWFCTRRGTTATPSGSNIGMRIGGQAAPYRGESPTNPGTTRLTTPGERWVIASGPGAGLVGYTYAANVFASINCLR